MREIVERMVGEAAREAAATLTLPFDDRRKSRQRVVLGDGEAAALLLAPGTVLRDGDLLRCRDGALVRVVAAPEPLSRVRSLDRLMLTRAAYHLGNRHIPVAIEGDCLLFQHDHVLDDMVRGLGLKVDAVTAPFQPEGGAYAHGGHGHDHDHDHDHD